MITIAVTSEKGGVGKTTVVANLAALLGELGPTLAVDCDPQGSLSAAFGVHQPERDLGDVLLNEDDPRTNDTIIDVGGGVGLLPAWRPSLEEADRRLTTEAGGHGFLRTALRGIGDEYSYAVIDTPANLGTLTLNAVCAADYVVGVFISQPWSMRGVGVIGAFVDKHRRRELTDAEFIGLLTNMHEPRLRLTRAIQDAVSHAGAETFTATIPRAVRIAEAAAVEAPIVVADPHGGPAEAFRAFRDELIARISAQEKNKRRRRRS